MRERTNTRRQQYASEQRCVQCGDALDSGGGLHCTEHILKLAAYRWLDNVHAWKELRSLFERQGGRCAYTGTSLRLGVDASIDHKVPRSRGGTNEIGNLQWVTWSVNRCKTDFTHDEFLALCQTVTERAWMVAVAPMDKVFERVPSVQVPVRGDLHLPQQGSDLAGEVA